jgi:hypothetical protein
MGNMLPTPGAGVLLWSFVLSRVVLSGKWKVNVKLSLCLINLDIMETYVGVEVYLHAFLTSALDGSE